MAQKSTPVTHPGSGPAIDREAEGRGSPSREEGMMEKRDLKAFMAEMEGPSNILVVVVLGGGACGDDG
jgi:hypothetical protein